jgi:hypothetical protein
MKQSKVWIAIFFLRKLCGRPLFAAYFWDSLVHLMGPKSKCLSTEPANIVTEALKSTVKTAEYIAIKLVKNMWNSSRLTLQNEPPRFIIAWLHFLMRMGYGTRTLLESPTVSTEIMDAMTKGVLQVRVEGGCIDIGEEPSVMNAITTVVNSSSARDASLILHKLSGRVIGTFGHVASKGASAEDCIVWVLLERYRIYSEETKMERMPLKSLLSGFLVDPDAFPENLETHWVILRRGQAAILGQDAKNRCFLDLFVTHGKDIILHTTPTNGAAPDFAFFTFCDCPEDATLHTETLAISSIKNVVDGSIEKTMRSLDIGSWYPNISERRSNSRNALSALLATHPRWCTPIRIPFTSRGWHDTTIAQVRWLNEFAFSSIPIILARYTVENLGVNIGQELSESPFHPPSIISAYWPTVLDGYDSMVPVKFLEKNEKIYKMKTSRSVRFKSTKTSVKVDDIRIMINNFGPASEILKKSRTLIQRLSNAVELVVTYQCEKSAIRAVAQSLKRDSRFADMKLTAEFFFTSND